MKYFFTCFLSLFLLLVPTAYAQSLPPNSLTVNPSLLQLDLSQDKPEGILTYTNTSSDTMQITLSASDFAPLEDGYKISFLQKKDANNYRYALSSWIDFSSKTMTISPHSSEKVTVFIDKDKLTPGGHYASIFAELSSIGKNNVQIQGVLASLLFVRTHTGQEREAATILSFFPQQDAWNFPETMVTRLNNTGDTVLTPHGLITITDPFGHYVAKGIVNDASAQSLPESIRRFDTPIKPFTPFLFPGLYTAHLTFQAGKIQKEETISFFTFGSISLLELLIVLGVIVNILILFRKKLPLKRSLQH